MHGGSKPFGKQQFNSVSKPLKIAWGFTLLLYIVCSTTFFAGSDYVIISTLSLYAFLGMSAMCMIFRYGVKLDLYFGGLVVFAAAVIFGTFYSESYDTVNGTMYDYITMMVIVFCIMNYISSEKDFILVLRSVMISGVTLSGFILINYGDEFFSTIASPIHGNFRFGSDLTNANSIGVTTAVGFVIGLAFVLNRRESILFKLFDAACTCFCGFFSIMTASKKAIIILAVGAFCVFVFKRDTRKHVLKKIAFIFVAVAVVAGLLYAIQNVPMFVNVNRRLSTFTDYIQTGESGNVSDRERMQLIEDGLGYFRESPVFGKGTDASKHYFGKYSHSNYVELLMNFGIVGFSIFYFGYLVISKRILKRLFTKDAFGNTDVLAAILFGIIVISGVGMVYYYDRFFNIIVAATAAYTSLYASSDTFKALPDTKQAAKEQ